MFLPQIQVHNSKEAKFGLSFNTPSKIKEFRSSLLNWFNLHGRHWIPWKLQLDGAKPKKQDFLDPYKIWIAEIMLQQTQVKVVLPYWMNWINNLGTLDRLINASEKDVLFLWQGLGYYSRAKRIYQTSKILADYFSELDSLDNNSWPKDIETWSSFPGIGLTTAGSILSSAFNAPFPILDGNVKRLLSRITCFSGASTKDLRQLFSLSEELLDPIYPRDFNQALMDLGSTICTVKNPKCLICPVKKFCLAFHNHSQSNYPYKKSRKTLESLTIGIGIILNKAGEVLIDQRLEHLPMGGMWEFPGGKKINDESIEETISREIFEELSIQVKVGRKLIDFNHLYTHKNLYFVVHLCTIISGNIALKASQRFLWVSPTNLCKYPFPAANIKMINALNQFLENQ